MNDTTELKVMFYNESTSQSIVSDLFTFSLLCLSLLFNYEYLGNSILVKLVIIVCFFSSVFARVSKTTKKLTTEEAIEYFKKLEAENDGRKTRVVDGL